MNFIFDGDGNFYGHKHFPPWFSLPKESYFGPDRFYNFEDSDNVLFIVIFRNPYDWLRSFHAKPWHCSKNLIHLPFSSFIREKWSLNPLDPCVITQSSYNPLIDLNPLDGSLFTNVMKLRSAKIENMLEIKNKVQNIYFINYEVIKEHPLEVLEELENLFNLTQADEYRPVVYYKGDSRQGYYQPKKYDPISQFDLNFINSQLDEELEEKIGYHLIYNANKLIKK